MTLLSTELFEWFYEKGFPPHVQLANISGGTDIVRSQYHEPTTLTKLTDGKNLTPTPARPAALAP